MRKLQIIIPLILIISYTAGFRQESDDLFISEYIEGSGNNKAIEIFNPTQKIIGLNNYYLARYSNGSNTYTDGGITRLTGSIIPLGTHVLVNGQTTSTETSPASSPKLRALADQLDHDYPAPTYFNGNDAIALFKDSGGNGDINDFVLVDLFGIIGGGMPTSAEGWASITDQWIYRNIYENSEIVGKDSAYVTNYIIPDGYYFLRDILWSANHSLIRKPNVVKGVTASTMPTIEFDVTIQWDTLPVGPDNWSNLGKHSFLRDTCLYSNMTVGIKTSDLLCNGDNNGEIELSVSGNFPPYDVLWSNNDTTRIINNLSAGYYVANVKDNMGCNKNVEAFLYEPEPLDVALEATNLNCYSDSTAHIQLVVIGGTGPYTFILNNDTVSFPIEYLSGGIYQLQIIDVNKCKVEKDFIIEEPEPVTIGNIIGETNPEKYETYQYSVSDEAGASFTWMVQGGNIVSGQGTNVANIQWGYSEDALIKILKETNLGCFSDTAQLAINIVNTNFQNNFNGQLRIFPNPAESVIHIDFPTQLQISIYDLIGNLRLIDTKKQIDVSTLPPGTYILEAADNSSQEYRTLIVRPKH